MGWKETHVEDERLALVRAFEVGDRSRADICRLHGVSRKTGYKWYQQYLRHGPAGLADRSRRPKTQGQLIDDETVGAVLAARGRFPYWGERKLKVWLEKHDRDRRWPSSSAIGEILQRHGLTRSKKPRPKAKPSGKLVRATTANQVWAIDFKGWFLVGDGRRCEPLTICDTHTRYLLRCQTVERTGTEVIRPLLEATFREYGLPGRIRSDNGAPFASTGIGGLSRLSVWWVRLGIVPERIAPGHPEQNGIHERMHRTLKQETATPPERTLRAQQKAFDCFVEIYNEERPHEALEMATPGSAYERSARRFPERLPELEYPPEYALRRVEPNGAISWRNGRVFLGEALAGETVGVEEAADGWRIWFGPLALAWLDERQTSDRKRRRDARGRGRWKAQFLDGSGRPTGSSHRPKTKSGKG